VHRFIISALSLSSESHCDAFCTNAHYAQVGGRAPSSSPVRARLPCLHPRGPLALLRQHRRTLGRQVLPPLIIILQLLRFFPATTNTNDPSSLTTTSFTRGTPGSNPGTSDDEMTFNSPQDGAGSAGIASDNGSASIGAISPAVPSAAAGGRRVWLCGTCSAGIRHRRGCTLLPDLVACSARKRMIVELHTFLGCRSVWAPAVAVRRTRDKCACVKRRAEHRYAK
jgi:hypothetical protein